MESSNVNLLRASVARQGTLEFSKDMAKRPGFENAVFGLFGNCLQFLTTNNLRPIYAKTKCG